MKASRHFLNDRDIQILNFLWTYKVSTTAILYHKFFSNITLRSAYCTLQKLRKYSYITVRTDEYGKKPLWTLEKKGFKVVKLDLPELAINGFKSESREHDLICTSVQLGEFFKEIPKDINIVTEQMLRTYHADLLPDWVPDVDEHRPDGYWYFKNGKDIKLMSLEVEINKKAFTRYQGYSGFYEKFDKKSRVLWIVKYRNQARQILKAMYKYKPEYIVHNFVELKDILNNGWDSLIFAGGDKGTKVHSLFYENSEYISSNSLIKCFANYILDRRLTYCITSKSAVREKIQSRDSMGTSS